MTVPTPSPGTPAPPPSSPIEAQSQNTTQFTQTATAIQSMAVRELAATLDTPPPAGANVIKGTVTAISSASSPPTITINISGDTTQAIAGVRYVDSYSPEVNDTILVVKQGSDLFAVGQIADSFSESTFTAPSLGSGFTTNGNSNGPVGYRLVVDNGAKKLQFEGSVAISGSPTALFTLPTGYRPAYKRSVTVARDPQGGSNVAQIDINTSGAVTLVGGTTGPTSGGSGSTSSVDPVDSTTTFNMSSHNHSDPQGGTVGANGGGPHGHGVTGSHSHSVSSHSHTVSYPNWISFNGVEVFL